VTSTMTFCYLPNRGVFLGVVSYVAIRKVSGFVQWITFCPHLSILTFPLRVLWCAVRLLIPSM